jgi:hypothetical protein
MPYVSYTGKPWLRTRAMLGACGLCDAGSHHFNERNSIIQEVSKWSVANSGKRYRIYQGTAQNVFEIDEAGWLIVGLCFIPSGELVAGDVMLAQKIALETNENGALAVAHRFLPRGSFARALRRPRRYYGAFF